MAEIRRLARDEAVGLRDLRLRALASAPRELGRFLAEERDFPLTYWQAIADDTERGERRISVVADRDGELQGMVGGAYDAASRTVRLVALWVDPAARGRHVGRGLVEAVIAWAIDRDADRIELWVNDDNRPARELYRATGFSPDPGSQQPVPYAPEISETRWSRSP